MAFCNIQSKQAEALAKIIAKDVANKRNAGTPYNIDEAMSFIYDLMINNGQDIDRAVTMASLVPKAVLATVSQYTPNGAYLAPTLQRVGELITKCVDYDKVNDLLIALEDKAHTIESIEKTLNTVQGANLSDLVDENTRKSAGEGGNVDDDINNILCYGIL